MIKREQSHKIIKHKSTDNVNDKYKNRQHNIYSHKQLPQTRDITQINFLQKKLAEQIIAREQSYNELLKMIKYLEQTKKSKLPVQFQKLSNKKLLNPASYKEITVQTVSKQKQNDDLEQFKAQMWAFQQKKQQQQNKIKQELFQYSRQIQSIKQKLNSNNNNTQILKLKHNFNDFITDYKEFKLQTIQKYQILSHRMTQQTNNQNIYENLCNQFHSQSILTKNITNQLNIYQDNLQKLNDVNQILRQKLCKFQQKVNDQFQILEQQVKNTNKLVYQVKNNIEQLFYGRRYQNEQKIQQYKGMSYDEYQKIQYFGRRIQSLQTRIDNIDNKYLALSKQVQR